MEPILVTLFRHNLWANEVLLSFCEGQGDRALNAIAEGGLGPARVTLWHIIANEEGYLSTITQEPQDDPLFELGYDVDLRTLRARMEQSGTRLIELAQAMPAEQRVSGTWEGQPYDMPASIPLLQGINHGTEHRGQVRSALSVAGITPPKIDLWWYQGAHPHL
jgi:uncharacterized damage-inducible protein DinB